MGKCVFNFHRFSCRKYFTVIRIVTFIGEVNEQISRTGNCNFDFIELSKSIENIYSKII